MRRALALLLTVFSVMLILPVHILRADEAHYALRLEANLRSIKGQSGKITFYAKSDAESIQSGKVYLYSESGEIISPMYDDATHGDGKAADGIYSCEVTLSSDKICTKKYYAASGSTLSYPVSVKFRPETKSTDTEYAEKLWDKIESYEKHLAEEGANSIEIAEKVYELVKASPHIYSIEKCTDKSFSFVLDSGIENYFEHRERERSAPCKSSYEYAQDFSYIQKCAIGVWSPYFGIYDDFTESYAERAHIMAETAGYDSVDTYYGENASLESFSHFDDYGIIMIDSHGADYDGGGYICIPAQADYDEGDVADGLIVLSGKTMLISGDFIAKYTDELANTVIYIGVCNGMQADNFYAPLMNHGAGFIAGFDESVSFTYDEIIMNDFCQRLSETNERTGRQYTAGEAYSDCISVNGSVDLYAKYHAHFVWYGNPDTVAAPIEIPVESAQISESELTLYHNNTYRLGALILPKDANRYSVTWASDSPDIAEVDNYGNLKVYGTDGEAHIFCTITDTSGDEDTVYPLSCTVTVAGHMPVTGIESVRQSVDVYAETQNEAKARVLPYNASEQGIVYTSLDESIATVDEEGIVTPVSSGDTYIKAESTEGGYSCMTLVHVKEGDINDALGCPGGALDFSADGNIAPEPTVYDGRLCVQFMNTGMNSASTVTLDAGNLQAGDMLIFDWSASCEAIYDCCIFTVNGKTFDEISGEKSWKTLRYTVKDDGSYIFKWMYKKDYSTSEGRDCAWLDNVDLVRSGIEYTVTFIGFDGEVISVQGVPHGESATSPDILLGQFCLYRMWDKDFSEVRSDMTVCQYDILLGDGNGDRLINTGDAVVVLKICAFLDTADGIKSIVCDFNGDGTINTGDAVAILKYVASTI